MENKMLLYQILQFVIYNELPVLTRAMQVQIGVEWLMYQQNQPQTRLTCWSGIILWNKSCLINGSGLELQFI